MNGKDLSDLVQDKCVLACRDFLKEELPDLAMEHPARYLSYLIERELKDREIERGLSVREDSSPFQCVRLSSAGGESFIVLGINMSRERVEEALNVLRSSLAKERVLLYLFSFESLADEELISQAMMETELLRMVRDSGIVAYFAMLDPRAGMGMLARIDGDMRSIQYLPH
ncbi:MAG TPA: hypothetical protein HA343_05500 [Methanomassiliicoccales archaeon]|nr:hypothetical protein [Methanomassiliicoccales archaeon]